MKYESVLKTIKIIWIVAVIFASIYYLFSRWFEIKNYFDNVSLFSLILSGSFLVVGKLSLVLLSKHSIEREGKELPFLDVFYIVAVTQLAKYMPGGIWHFVGRYSAYGQKQLTVKKSTRALVSENVWLLSGALLTGSLLVIFSQPGQQLIEKNGIRISAIVLGIIIFIIWFVILAVYDKVFPAEVSIHRIKIFSAQLVSWFCLGVSFSFILPSIGYDTFLYSVGAYPLGWLIGYVAVFAPGGVGIRETALIWLFSNVLNSNDALLYATIHRFLFIVVEILLGFVAGLISMSRKTLDPGNRT